MNNTCSIEGCERPYKRAGYCYSHYMKNWRYGTPEPQHAPRWEDVQGVRFGTLVAIERSDTGWLCLCDCGEKKVVSLSALNQVGDASTCGRRDVHRRLEEVGYHGAHSRVYQQYGSAKSYACTECGLDAQHWSYDHADPDERLAYDISVNAVPYSMDPNHYRPLCASCHKRFDVEVLGLARS